MGRPIAPGPVVAPNETYLQEAGVLSQEAGQSLQGPEVAPYETYLQEAGVQGGANRSRAPKWRLMRPTCRRVECSARRPQPTSPGPQVAGTETYLQEGGVFSQEASQPLNGP
jgi:hypothetical protein